MTPAEKQLVDRLTKYINDLQAQVSSLKGRVAALEAKP